MNESQIKNLVEEFWRLAGDVEDFPRTLEKSILWALPIAIIKLPRLCTDKAVQWLRQNEISVAQGCEDRPLRACLLAHGGNGLIFLDGADDPAEMRFSLAHETAHFLGDYWRPRQDAARELGDSIFGVLDGNQQATCEQRLQAVLRGVALNEFAHFMLRDAQNRITSAATLAAEDRADRIGLELLAPAAAVLAHLRADAEVFEEQGAARTLRDVFGLPPDVADRYARFLAARYQRPPTFRQWLFA